MRVFSSFDRELQLTHDLAQLVQGLFGLPPLAQDHEVIGVGHEPCAKALFKSKLLPSQHKPAHVKISQQWGDR